MIMVKQVKARGILAVGLIAGALQGGTVQAKEVKRTNLYLIRDKYCMGC